MFTFKIQKLLMIESEVITGLKKGDNAVLKKIYVAYRPDFIAFARKFSVSEDDIVDCYQDAIIALQEQAIKGKLNNLKSSVKTYLFGIGKYMIYEKARKNNKTVMHIADSKTIDEVPVDFSQEINKQQQQLKKGFEKLGKKCRQVLTLFYYRGYTIEEIAEHLNYENKNVVKSQKSRCLKQLKQMLNPKSNK